LLPSTNGRETDILSRSCDSNGRKHPTDVSDWGNRVGEGKLQIDQRVDRIESAIMILAQESHPQETVDKIEQILKGKAYAEPWPTAQES